MKYKNYFLLLVFIATTGIILGFGFDDLRVDKLDWDTLGAYIDTTVDISVSRVYDSLGAYVDTLGDFIIYGKIRFMDTIFIDAYAIIETTVIDVDSIVYLKADTAIINRADINVLDINTLLSINGADLLGIISDSLSNTARWEYFTVGTADTAIRPVGNWSLTRLSNILYGDSASTHINLGIECTTGIDGSPQQDITIGGGRHNFARTTSSTVGGGIHNRAYGSISTIGGGIYNDAIGAYSAIPGGYYNSAHNRSVVVAGDMNNASGPFSVISGGRTNYARGSYAVVCGGVSNKSYGNMSTLLGGKGNKIDYGVDLSLAFGAYVNINQDSTACFFNADYPGYFGINTETPSVALEVNGDIYAHNIGAASTEVETIWVKEIIGSTVNFPDGLSGKFTGTGDVDVNGYDILDIDTSLYINDTDSGWISMAAGTLHVWSNGEVKVGQNSLVISEGSASFGGDLSIRSGDTLRTDHLVPANGSLHLGEGNDTIIIESDSLVMSCPVVIDGNLTVDTLFGDGSQLTGITMDELFVAGFIDGTDSTYDTVHVDDTLWFKDPVRIDVDTIGADTNFVIFLNAFQFASGYPLGADTIVVNDDKDTIATPPTGLAYIDTTGGDTLKVYLNSNWEPK